MITGAKLNNEFAIPNGTNITEVNRKIKEQEAEKDLFIRRINV